jgi:regulator of protease activity HflC (stomatin/prohibitin superfamily)
MRKNSMSVFGVRFLKVNPTEFILQYRNGKLAREGAGLSFFYFEPTTSLVKIPIGSVDIPFIFEETTADFQTISIQGQLTYRITDPKKIAKMLNFTLRPDGEDYQSDDHEKLPQRLVSHAKVLTSASLKSLKLKETLGQSQPLADSLQKGLQTTETITSLGIEILGLSILAIKPNPETARALEAEAREKVLRESDEAIYSRRNASVEQERNIKENELNTEIAVEHKKRQIQETKMDAEKAVQQKQQEIYEQEILSKISLEEKNRTLVALVTENMRAEADAKAYAMTAMMASLEKTNPKTLQALASVGMKPSQLVALAFKELAENSEKIGQLNMTPDLLSELLNDGKKR